MNARQTTGIFNAQSLRMSEVSEQRVKTPFFYCSEIPILEAAFRYETIPRK